MPPPSRFTRFLADVEEAPAPGRYVVVWVACVVLLLSVIGAVLAWRSYHDRVIREEDGIGETAEEAALITERFFADRIAMLEAVAHVPAIQSADPATMLPALEALSRPDLGFGGGVGWADLDGVLRAEAGTDPAVLPVNIRDRWYVDQVLTRQAPVVSEVIKGRLSGDELVVLATPTYDAGGDMTGILIASVRMGELDSLVPLLSPTGVDARVVDRTGSVALHNGEVASLEPAANPELLERAGSGAVTGTGLEGQPRRVVAPVHIPTPGWTLVVEQAASVLLRGARSRFVGELAVLATLALLTIAGAVVAARRLDASHRRAMQSAQDLAALGALRGATALATTADAAAGRASTVFGDVFDTEAVSIGITDLSGARFRVWGSTEPASAAGASAGSPGLLVETMKVGEPVILDAADLRTRALLLDRPGAEETRLLAAPFSGRKLTGAVAVAAADGGLTARMPLFEAMVAHLGEAFERVAAIEAERSASRTFQRALLPRDTIGVQVPLQRAVRYVSSDDAEVGGDWYDLWLIDDTHVGVVVGDVVGRGVEAAAAMGQLRSGLRAITAAVPSPDQALAQLEDFARQLAGSPSATVVLGVVDVESGALTMASAGHPPPLLATSGGVRVLHEVKGVPIGFVNERRIGATCAVRLEADDTVVIYSDGLVERRGEVIDQGIARLQRALLDNAHRPIESVATALVEECLGDQDDDVALVCLRRVEGRPRHFTCISPLETIDVLLHALRQWLEPLGTDHDIEAAVAAVGGAIAVVTEVCGTRRSCEVLVEIDADGPGEVVVEHRDASLAGDSADAGTEILRRWGSGARLATGVRTTVPLVMSPGGG